MRLIQAIYPMIDDRGHNVFSRQVTRERNGVWAGEHNAEGWQWYLAGAQPTIYSSPARASAAQLAGLAPVYIDVGELDVFRDECLHLALALSVAVVPTELHLTPGLFHAAEHVVPDAATSTRLRSYRHDALARALRAHWPDSHSEGRHPRVTAFLTSGSVTLRYCA